MKDVPCEADLMDQDDVSFFVISAACFCTTSTSKVSQQGRRMGLIK